MFFFTINNKNQIQFRPDPTNQKAKSGFRVHSWFALVLFLRTEQTPGLPRANIERRPWCQRRLLFATENGQISLYLYFKYTRGGLRVSHSSRLSFISQIIIIYCLLFYLFSNHRTIFFIITQHLSRKSIWIQETNMFWRELFFMRKAKLTESSSFMNILSSYFFYI